MFRRKLGDAIAALAQGHHPVQPTALGEPVPTYGGGTVVHMPEREGKDDDELILETSRRIATAYESGDGLKGAERDAFVQNKLAEI